MRFFNDRKPRSEIRSLDAWEMLAGPVSAKHWKVDRSARELARAWIENGACAHVEGLLSAHPDLAPVTLEEATAEKRTRFDDIPHGPRNHDLLVLGSAAPGRIVVGVEGKADETFGETLARYRDRERSPASRATERLEKLTRTFFGRTLAEDGSLETVRYQLRSALAGTLADARSQDAAAAILLVHEFRTAATERKKHEANAQDLDRFLGALRGEAPARANSSRGWVVGPWTIKGDGEWLPGSLPVYVAHLAEGQR
jgi:hypothetical protein